MTRERAHTATYMGLVPMVQRPSVPAFYRMHGHVSIACMLGMIAVIACHGFVLVYYRMAT